MKKIVVIWASNNREKYGNKIVKDLISKWFDAIPVNPKENKIEWIESFKSLSDITDDYDAVTFVIRPDIWLKILEENTDVLINKKIWFQPWASNENIVSYLQENNFSDYITDSCIMLDTLKNES